MERVPAANNCFGHNYYSQAIQEDENVQARVKAILNQIHENRVTVKELHTEFATKFSDIIITYQNRLEDNIQHYDSSIKDLISKREQILSICSKVKKDKDL